MLSNLDDTIMSCSGQFACLTKNLFPGPNASHPVSIRPGFQIKAFKFVSVWLIAPSLMAHQLLQKKIDNHSKNSKVIDAVQLNLLNNTYCDEHSVYGHFGQTLNQNQLCAGIPSNGNYTIPFSGQYEEDFGGPLICLDKSQKPVFTGIASSNSLSTKQGHPGIYTNIFQNKAWIRNVTGKHKLYRINYAQIVY